MRYGSLKRQTVKTFKTGTLDGGIDYFNLPDGMKNNKIPTCNNMWYKNSRLQTRPGFKADCTRAVDTMIYGSTGELEYTVTDTAVYYDGQYQRIATANVLTDDYAHYTYVYLLDLDGNMTPIGHMAFLRIASDVFYMPISINFFNGKPQNGGGIYATVTLQDRYDPSQKSYYIYEVNADFTEWERVYDYYVPTVLIGGRGNKYQTAKIETGFTLPAPTTLESQNMLDGRFHAYYTSDGYSNSFRLPFNSLASEEISCKIYYSLTDYIEWVIPANGIRDIQTFYNQPISAFVDRDTGTLYFTTETGDFAVPIMDMCSENNIKVTATKEIENGFANIVHSTCTARHNSRLLLAGGENGNTVYSADYENPLYFPKDSSVEIGEGNSGITRMVSIGGKVLVFKEHELHLLSVHEGNTVNKITLLSDNGKVFKSGDSFTAEQLSGRIGCKNGDTVARSATRCLWLSEDNRVYRFDLSGKKITEVFYCPELDYSYRDEATALGGDDCYILALKGKIAVVDISDISDCKIFFWQTPVGLNIESGFYYAGEYRFLCTGKDSRLAFMATLAGKTDSVLYFGADEDRTIMQNDIPVSCGFSTKYYCPDGKNTAKNIEGIYFTMSAKGKVKITVNDKYKTEINFGFLNEDYDKCEYKSVRLSPHLYNTDGISIAFESDKEISVGEIEIRYRVTG